MFRSVFRPALFPAAAVAARNAVVRSAALHTLRPLSAVVARPGLSAVQRPATWIFGSARRYSPITTDEPAKILEFPQVEELVAKKPEDIVIVDVREPSEFAEGHIPSAINIPVKSSPGALGLEAEEFHDTFGFDKPDQDKTLVFYCLGGVRSTTAEELACTFGYQKRGNYKGSWADWVKHGGPIEGPAKPEAEAKL
ncbi:hypothetical protein DV451_004688 [Geotrichum candidum]|uniref:Similar to Saccharomyces cerevisiae YOR286W RDL2 Protein with rhodanese activity n=1 Tax=Geotrichum candidum TaxID=1173061 RepID=A0A0J9XDQ3_GEOCN|nr:hypothetical protein DV451_004688 [Geotrichum candidum]KAF5109426.1 hypothetical protein DV453_001605 [Geotrichum candidum]KAF5116152.1 hypothetical protein DV452_002736 [Geotrichum candidum]KAF5121371.1 hypothetical protein DV495_004349 [Geotrichum candidum]KAF7497251.1 hypothetical protein DV113_004716 [Geotrichum candidum]